eukprot:TRINITY_DN4507_c1_g4_i1.p1 TRINITY_DN4507_c1_g4~~TRINITY_DN4507_c1_g4_i1.p1  ORF type:complete len:193 (-),score=28.72 TRINITY_DN4507_c1_g4_i1:47-625(-)
MQEDFESLVNRVKDLQRKSPAAKEQWGQQCESAGYNFRDPSRHTPEFIRNFLAKHERAAVEASEVADLFKAGQRRSAHWKEAWASYCQQYGNHVHDPAKHEEFFMIAFLDYLGYHGHVAISNGEGAPPGKRSRREDPIKDDLIERIKAFQRSDDDAKQSWHNYCDANPCRIRDPSRHTLDFLKVFVERYNVP